MQFRKYESRVEAGELLVAHIKAENYELYENILQSPKDYFCYAIPNGGVPVSEGFCSGFNLQYDILIVRKIKIPYNTEAGFGSVTTNGSVLINQHLLPYLNLNERDVERAIAMTRAEIKDRLEFYNKNVNLGNKYKDHIKGKSIFILDDGLASGFTMLAAIKMILNYAPTNIFVAVPTAPLRTLKLIRNEIDNIFCPNIREVSRFAVAEAYNHWYDIPESEVLEIINKSNFYTNTIDKKIDSGKMN